MNEADATYLNLAYVEEIKLIIRSVVHPLCCAVRAVLVCKNRGKSSEMLNTTPLKYITIFDCFQEKTQNVFMCFVSACIICFWIASVKSPVACV